VERRRPAGWTAGVPPARGRRRDAAGPAAGTAAFLLREEAVENAREAIQGYIAALEEDSLPVPPDHLEAIVVAV